MPVTTSGLNASGLLGEPSGDTPRMNGNRKSDRLVVPKKQTNKESNDCGVHGGKESERRESCRANNPRCYQDCEPPLTLLCEPLLAPILSTTVHITDIHLPYLVFNQQVVVLNSISAYKKHQ